MRLYRILVPAILTLTACGGGEEEVNWRNNCIWRLKKGSTEDNLWKSTCDSQGGQTANCLIDDVLTRAYCRKQYQGIMNF